MNGHFPDCSWALSSGPRSSQRQYLDSTSWMFLFTIGMGIRVCARDYLKTDVNRTVRRTNLFNLAVAVTGAALSVWQDRRDVNCLVGLHMAGKRGNMVYKLHALPILSGAVFHGMIGWHLLDVVAALVLWRSRGGRMTQQVKAVVVYLLFITLVGAACVSVLPQLMPDLLLYPFMFFLAPEEAPSGERIMLELVAAVVAVIGAWAIWSRQDQVVRYLAPALRTAFPPEKGTRGSLTQDVKHSDGPEAGVA
ncbi:hypothetical protein K461DRAFT_276606 [Myriangium duriaei CBS 260.36]|uniref:Uncharacterized protein n=1 Tax=Myriangium duriaei CBS 260.36 TaxID=1168546 RepID=A0A9P4J941_9PEZI|nr:hypothetical protein K461DRAFT_276606 [Myriangium duriaei CBS 260.36]